MSGSGSLIVAWAGTDNATTGVVDDRRGIGEQRIMRKALSKLSAAHAVVDAF
jgi:hypothetical protein